MKKPSLSINEISPYVKFVSEYKADSNFRFRKRILYDHLIEYIYDGKGLYVLQDKDYQVARGDAVFIPPGVVHSISADKKQPFIRQCVHFDFIYLGYDDPKPEWEWFPSELQQEKIHPTPIFSEQINLPAVSHLLQVPKMRPLFARLFREMYRKQPGYQIATKACMLDILLLIHRNGFPEKTESAEESSRVLPKPVADAKRFMEINFCQKLTLSAIADIAHYHPAHFGRIFKQFMGCSPIEYLLELRINRAKEFLDDSELNISEISDKVGFESVQYFSLVFKKLVGFAPRHYRKLIQKSGNSELRLPLTHLKDYPTHKLLSHTSKSK